MLYEKKKRDYVRLAGLMKTTMFAETSLGKSQLSLATIFNKALSDDTVFKSCSWNLEIVLRA